MTGREHPAMTPSHQPVDSATHHLIAQQPNPPDPEHAEDAELQYRADAIAPEPCQATNSAAGGAGQSVKPLLLPGSPAHLTLHASHVLEGMPSTGPGEGPQWWQVHVHHQLSRLQDQPLTAPVGTLMFAKLPWYDHEYASGEFNDTFYDFSCAARRVFEAADDPANPIHRFMLNSHGDLLVLLDAHLNDEWRGFGITALLAAQAVAHLVFGCRIAVIGSTDPSSYMSRLAVAAGFEVIGDDLAVSGRRSLEQARQHSEQWRERLEELVSLVTPRALPPF
ncbi:hypothetical protein ACIQ7Q_24655 [Streptomyces sp. NPDC096176]|uniref:hypothetical protein n=1 Tax=Streptomyces sp. NPDC096176 TaxID=3366079 RepID=UPI003800B4CC